MLNIPKLLPPQHQLRTYNYRTRTYRSATKSLDPSDFHTERITIEGYEGQQVRERWEKRERERERERGGGKGGDEGWGDEGQQVRGSG